MTAGPAESHRRKLALPDLATNGLVINVEQCSDLGHCQKLAPGEGSVYMACHGERTWTISARAQPTGRSSHNILSIFCFSAQGKAWAPRSLDRVDAGAAPSGVLRWRLIAAGPFAFHPETLLAEVVRRAAGQEEPPVPEGVPRIRRAVEAPVPRVAVCSPHVNGHRSPTSLRAFA
jgi:hypothetical protein